VESNLLLGFEEVLLGRLGWQPAVEVFHWLLYLCYVGYMAEFQMTSSSCLDNVIDSTPTLIS
jgi:hypothetical protein